MQLETIFAGYSAKLFTFAAALTRDRVAAGALVEETALRFHTLRDKPAADGALRDWLFGTLYRLWRAGNPQDEASGAAEGALSLRDALYQLPRPAREVLAAVDIAGLSYPQTAVLLDLDCDSVSARVAEARETMLRLLLPLTHEATAPRLHAFVDGALPADEAASITAAMQRDPALAAQISDLRQLKAEIAAHADPVPVLLLPRRAGRGRVWALALALVAVVLAASGAWIIWRDRPVAITSAPVSAPVFTGNLTGERDFLARHDFRPAPLPAGGGGERSYLGLRGCRLTIIEGEAEALARIAASARDRQTALLEGEGHARLLLAENMGPDRFAFFAEMLGQVWQAAPEAIAPLLAIPAPAAPSCVG